MRQANLMVDRDPDKKTPAEAARWLDPASDRPRTQVSISRDDLERAQARIVIEDLRGDHQLVGAGAGDEARIAAPYRLRAPIAEQDRTWSSPARWAGARLS